MNDLILKSFNFQGQICNIMGKDGRPWFVAKDVAKILDISSYRRTIATFPKNEKSYVVCAVSSTDITYRRCDITSTDTTCDVYSIYGTCGKSRARKTQKLLIINESGVLRLIQNSRKEKAKEFKEHIIKFLSDCLKHNLNWAVLPRTWTFRGKEYTWAEWVNLKRDWYFKRFPYATQEQFEAILLR
jgi:prophage antirepressor-like protein